MNFDESATSLRRNFDEYTTKQRQNMTNEFDESATSLRRRRLFEKWPINSDESAASLRCRRLVENDQWISSNLRCRYNVITTKMRRKTTNKFWRAWDVAATSQISRKWPINFVESATSLQRIPTKLRVNCDENFFTSLIRRLQTLLLRELKK